MQVTILKVGGGIVENPASLASFLDDVAALPGNKVIVHGGGRSATAMASRMGVETTMIEGRRVTDSAMLEIVTMVYGGLVNKNVVASLQARGVNAVGLTGADMNLILSDRRRPAPVDYGWVGDPREVNAAALTMLLDGGFTPVVAPLTHDGNGHILNTNADTIAATVARGLAASGHDVTLTYCFEKPGVLADADDDSSVIPLIDSTSYTRLRADGVVSGGMIPKLDNAFAALNHGVKAVVITSASNLGGGTRILL